MAQSPSLFSRLVGLITGSPPAAQPLPNPETVKSQLERLNLDYNSKVERLVDGFTQGTISFGQFDGALRSLIRQQHLAAAIVSEGGVENATPDTYALAQQQIDTQMGFFEAWMSELYEQFTSGDLPSAEYLANRAKLYGKAAGETAARGSIQAMGLPTLPFYPGQGTQCKVNCKCSWSVRTQDVVNGSYDCYWTLGANEHCPTCLARSRAANPLKVRRGVIVNAERYQAAGLYA